MEHSYLTTAAWRAFLESTASTAVTGTDLELAYDSFYTADLSAKPFCRPQIPVVRNHTLQVNDAIFYRDGDVRVVEITVGMQRG